MGQQPSAAASADDLETLAAALGGAFRAGPAVPSAPWVARVPDAAAAFRLQDAVVRASGLFGAEGGGARAWKSGGAERVDERLTHAPLPFDRVRPSPADFRDLPLRRRGIEAEIALRLARAVTAEEAAQLSDAAARELIEAMAPAIELVDSRWAESFDAPELLRLADLQSNAGLAVGAWRPFRALDWKALGGEVRVGAQAPFAFRGTHGLDDPAWVVRPWLRHATRHGATVPAGCVVTTGTWCGVRQAQAGDRVLLAFEAFEACELRL